MKKIFNGLYGIKDKNEIHIFCDTLNNENWITNLNIIEQTNEITIISSLNNLFDDENWFVNNKDNDYSFLGNRELRESFGMKQLEDETKCKTECSTIKIFEKEENYLGFTFKPGFAYFEDGDKKYATSGWEMNNFVMIYTLDEEENKWEGDWKSKDDFQWVLDEIESESENIEIQEWKEITAIEKVADFVAKFIKQTGIESHAVISDIMDNLHKDWASRIDDDHEFQRVDFIKFTDVKEFAKRIKLADFSTEYCNETEYTRENATLLYGNADDFEFGEAFDYSDYEDNEDGTYKQGVEGNFNINKTYVILISTYTYNSNDCDDSQLYKCIAYVGDESVYNFEHKEIIEKYGIIEKVIEWKDVAEQ